MNQAVIFNIQRFSVHDGPGLRTTVFFKGCSLRCRWCHNPESYEAQCQVGFLEEKCIGCGSCLEACRSGAIRIGADGRRIFDPDRCSACMACVQNCYAKAMYRIGRWYTPQQLVREILEDKPYFDSAGEGGVTFSGGECMLYADFLSETARACRKEGISVAVDTAGNVPFASFEKVLPYTDLFLYDMKAFSSAVHREGTGCGNERILENLLLLQNTGKRILIRIPVVPQINAGELPLMAAFLKEHGFMEVELLAYHGLGNGKRKQLGMKEEKFTEPSKKDMEEYAELFRTQGLTVTV